MDKVQIIQDLLNKTQKLKRTDEESKYSLELEAKMVVRQVFGENHDYLNDLAHISNSMFKHQKLQNAWNRDQIRLINLFKVMLQEVELFNKRQVVVSSDLGNTPVGATSLIQDLIDNLDQLRYDDYAQLDAFQKRSDMIITKIFGISKHLGDFRKITFYPTGYRSDIQMSELSLQAWTLGKIEALNLFNTMLEDLQLSPINFPQVNNQKTSKRIFVVHGHDEAMKLAVARTIEKIGLEPIILHEQPNKGLTIIEKFVDYSDVGFAIALLSPDDIAYPNRDKTVSVNARTKRARQNVIFELGYFIGKLGRDKVFALYQEGVEIPSDYNGVLYTLYDKPDGAWRHELVRELRVLKYEVDANKLL